MLTHFENKYFTWFKQQFNIAGPHLAALQFAASEITVIVATDTALGPELTAVYRLDLPATLKNYAWLHEHEYLTSYVQANINCETLKGARAGATIDTAKTHLKELNMPVLTTAELEQAVKWDALQHLPYAEDTYSYSYLSERWENSNGEGLKVSLIATDKALTQAIQYLCKQLGLELLQITTTALALRELANNNYEHWSILDIGADSTQIYFFAKQRPVYQACINLGRVDFVKALSNSLKLSMTQANRLLDEHYALNQNPAKSQLVLEQIRTICTELSIQISLQLEDYLSKRPVPAIEAIVIIDTIPSINAELGKQISDQLHIQAELTKPLEQFLLADSLNLRNYNISFAPALGVLYALAHNSTFSLIPLVHTTNRRLRKYYKVILLLSVCIVIALSAYELALISVYKNKYQDLAGNSSQLLIWRKRQELITKLERDIQRREALLEQLEAQRTAWPQILLAFGYNIPEGVAITGISRVKDGDEYILRGKTKNIEAVNKFMAALQKTAVFSRISLEHISESSSISNSGEFLINLKGMGKGYATATYKTTPLP